MRSSLLMFASASIALATNLYVSSYSGTITSLRLTQSSDGSYALEKTSANNGSTPSPSWLTLDEDTNVLYCLDENLSGGDGSIASYKTSPSGLLTQVDRHSTITGPVSSIIYNGGKAQAVAHYTGSSVTSWIILDDGGLKQLQSFSFNLTHPNVNAVRQDASHPHEALVDPTDSFIVVPDLGADLVRIFSINASTSELTPVTPLAVPAGSGPRHGAFLVQDDQTYFFLISELANTVVSYKVTYGPESLTFDKIFTSGTFGNMTVPKRVTSAEAIISPDQKFLLTSSRNDSSFVIPNFDPSNSTDIISDALQTWAINANGTLTFKQMIPAGGFFPRQFSVNKAGTLAAVGMQYGSSVVIVQRQPDGLFGDFVAEVKVDGEVTSVVWDESEYEC